jgi:hypothetical protein
MFSTTTSSIAFAEETGFNPLLISQSTNMLRNGRLGYAIQRAAEGRLN